MSSRSPIWSSTVSSAPNSTNRCTTSSHRLPRWRGPKGWGQSLCWGDPEYEEHLAASSAWKKVHDAIHSQAWIDFIVAELGDFWEREGCVVDLGKAVYVPYCEVRADKELFHLRRPEYEPHELWCRLDFYPSCSGYYRPVHLDHRRRLISMLVYFQDHDEEGMEGGELILHPPALDLRILEKLKLYHAPKSFSWIRDRLAGTVDVKPKHNRMAVSRAAGTLGTRSQR